MSVDQARREPTGGAPRRRTARPGAALLGGVLMLTGCAATVERTAEVAAPPAVEGAVEALHDQREQIAAILRDPEILAASADFAAAVVVGALAALTDEDRLGQVGRGSERLVQRFGAALARSLERDLRPQIAATVAETLDRSMTVLLGDHTEQRAREIAAAITRASAQALAREVVGGAPEAPRDRAPAADAAPRSWGPAAALAQESPPDARPPAAAQAPAPSLAEAFGVIAREASRGLTLGFQDAVRDTELRRAAGDERPGDVLALVADTSRAGRGLLSAAALAAAALVLLLVAGLVWALLRARRYRAESRARQRTLLLLARAISPDDHDTSAEALRDRIRAAARGRTDAAPLRDALREHDLRLAPASHPPPVRG